MKAKKKKKSKAKSMSLFDQLGAGLDLAGQMKFTHSLIKHLDALYSKMLAGEISDINNQSEVDEEVTYIAGMPSVQKHAYYNPGHSSVTESM